MSPPRAKPAVFDALVALTRDCMTTPSNFALNDTEWTEILDLAQKHGVRPNLHRHLTTHPELAAPTQFIEKLSALVKPLQARGLLMFGELQRILALLDAQDIAAIPYKGPVLADYLFGSVTAREFADLDILIQPADAQRARALLLDAGLTSEHVSPFKARLIERFHCQYDFTVGANATLELNWDTVQRYWALPRLPNGMWERLQRVRVGPQTMWFPQPTDLFIILAVHGCKHQWECLKWVLDIDALLKREDPLDWQELYRRADAIGARTMVSTAVAVAHALYQSPVPEQAVGEISTGARVDRLTQMVLANMRQRRSGVTVKEELRFIAAASDSVAGRIMPRLLMPIYRAWHSLKV